MTAPDEDRTVRRAAIDIGTNTALLLVADVRQDGSFRIVHDEERFVRLGQGVDATGRVNDAAMERARVALLAHRATAERLGADSITLGATSASRDARNKDELIAFIERETGLRYRILSGEEEALWSFRGAVTAFPEVEGPVVVVDVGGGSTEVVVGETSGAVRSRQSLDVGTIRLTERFFSAQPPAPDEVARARTWVEEACRALPLDPDRPLPLIGASGTAITLAFIHRPEALARWPDVPPLTLTAADVRAWRDRLLGCTFEEVTAVHPRVMQGRADVFPAGVLILDVLMRRFRVPVLQATPRGLRHGLVVRDRFGG